MVDDATPRDELEPDDADLGDEDGSRPIVVSLNPSMERVTWQRIVGIGVLLGGGVTVGFLIYAFITLNVSNTASGADIGFFRMLQDWDQVNTNWESPGGSILNGVTPDG